MEFCKWPQKSILAQPSPVHKAQQQLSPSLRVGCAVLRHPTCGDVTATTSSVDDFQFKVLLRPTTRAPIRKIIGASATQQAGFSLIIVKGRPHQQATIFFSSGVQVDWCTAGE